MRYSEEVFNRVREPRRAGTLDGIQVRRNGDRIAEARFGCSAAIASASLVAEWLEGAAIDEAKALTPEQVVQTLAVGARAGARGADGRRSGVESSQ